MICRPTELPMERAALFIMASTTVSPRRPVPPPRLVGRPRFSYQGLSAGRLSLAGAGCRRLLRFALQPLVGRFAVHDFFVHAKYHRAADDLLPLRGSDGADLAVGRTNQGAFDNAGSSFFVEKGNQGLADREFA